MHFTQPTVDRVLHLLNLTRTSVPSFPPFLSFSRDNGRKQTYTEQWNSWREGETVDFHLPAFLSPGPAHALGHLFSPPSFAMPPEPPAVHAFGTRNGGDRGADPVVDSRMLGEARTCAQRSSTKYSPRGRRVASAARAGAHLSADSGNAVGAPGVDGGRVPRRPALLSSLPPKLSSSRSSGREANSLVKEGPWGLEDGDFGATMI